MVEKWTKNPELSFLIGSIIMVLGLFYLLVYAKFDATWNIVFPII